MRWGPPRSRRGLMSRGALAQAAVLTGFSFANAEAAAVVAEMTAQPDDARKGLIDTLVGSLKSDGIWSKVGVLYVLAAHDAQAARLNWKNPSGTAASEVNAPTFTVDRGYTGALTGDKYLSTGIAIGSVPVYSVTNNHLCVYSRSNVADLSMRDIGTGTGTFTMGTRTDADQWRIYVCSTGTPTISNTSSIGMFAMGRSSSGSTATAWKNGSKVYGPSTPTQTSTPSGTLLIGKDASLTNSTREIAYASCGGALDDTENTNLYNAVLAYLQAVGAA